MRYKNTQFKAIASSSLILAIIFGLFQNCGEAPNVASVQGIQIPTPAEEAADIFTIKLEITNPGQQVEFSIKGALQEINFGDDSPVEQATDATVVHTYASAGTYNLTALDDGCTEIKFLSQPVLEISGLEHIPPLRKLIVTNAKLTAFDTGNLPASLQFLDLGGNNIKNFKSDNLPSALQHLYLDGNLLTTFSTESLPNQLRYLYLNGNILETFDATSLPNSLERLYIYSNRITNITGQNWPSSLQYLHLSSNRLNDFNENQLPTSIKRLYLQGNRLPSNVVSRILTELASRSPASGSIFHFQSQDPKAIPDSSGLSAKQTLLNIPTTVITD